LGTLPYTYIVAKFHTTCQTDNAQILPCSKTQFYVYVFLATVLCFKQRMIVVANKFLILHTYYGH
jgi:hypothetical protein